MFFTIFAIVVVLLAAVGFALQKNGELSGIGSARGRLRAPHGRLVRTKRLDNLETAPFSAKLPRALAATFAVTVLIVLVSVLGVVDLSGPIPQSADIILVIVAAVGIVYQDAGIARPLGYAIAGYLVPAAVVTGIVWYGLAPAAGLDAAFCNGVSMVAGTFGAACAVAAMAPLRTYAREFADGYVSVIQVAASSTAARSLDKYLDPTWKPPADRVRDASDARDIREAMKRRDV